MTKATPPKLQLPNEMDFGPTTSEVAMQPSATIKLRRHISALSQRKAYLDRRILEEMKKRVPHGFTLQRLKKLKLDAKDRIAGARKQLGQVVIDTSLMMTGGQQPKLVAMSVRRSREQHQIRPFRSR